MEAYMKTSEFALRTFDKNNTFLFKDDFYNYSLQGRELVLSPVGQRKEKRYKLTNDEISQIMDYYVLPLRKIRNEYPYIIGFLDEALDIEDDLMAFVDSLIR